MAELTFMATVDESRILQLPPDAPLGRVEIMVREKPAQGSSEALLEAIRSVVPSRDPDFWRQAREELYRSRGEWDKN